MTATFTSLALALALALALSLLLVIPQAQAAKPAPPPPPPPPAPVTDTTLALASASASGQAANASSSNCGVSADGSKVLFTSYASNLVTGGTNFMQHLYLKDFNGNGITRVVTAASNTFACLALTPDANTVVFVANAPNGVVTALGFEGSEPAIMVKNLSTGQQTRVTPLRSAFANVDSYQFAGVSDDGLRVAFIAQPTFTCSGYDCIANGPARMLLRDLSSGALVNLESQVRFTTSQGFADGNAWLSPNGRTLAFSSRAAYPEAGDADTANKDVYALDIASNTVRLVNTDAAGGQITGNYNVQTFLANSGKLAFSGATSAGLTGMFVKDLTSGAFDLVFDRNLVPMLFFTALSFSDDGRKVAYSESSGGSTLTEIRIPIVLDIATGARVNAATLSNGTVGNGRTTTDVLLSSEGKAAAFGNNSTNLLGGLSTVQQVYRKLLP